VVDVVAGDKRMREVDGLDVRPGPKVVRLGVREVVVVEACHEHGAAPGDPAAG
jgi:hypothetical protein